MTFFKRSISLFLILCMVLEFVPAVSASGIVDSGSCGADGCDVTWTLHDNGELVISGTGAMEDYQTTSIDFLTGETGSTAPWFDLRSQVTSVTVEKGVTHVGDYAFYRCTNAISANFAGTVKTIGESAFTCFYTESMALRTLSLSSGLVEIKRDAFSDCSLLQSLTIPDSVRTLGDRVFNNCSGITQLKLGNSITHIGSSAFLGCSKLTEVRIPDSVTTLGDAAFRWCNSVEKLTIGKGLTALPWNAFQEMESLTSLAIPGSIKTIGEGAFNGCIALQELTLHDGLQVIDYNAFSMTGLESVVLPATLTTLGAYAFSDNNSLRFATFKGKAPTMGNYVFDSCASDFSIYYPSNKADTGWSTPEWNGYPAYPYDIKGSLPETWPVNNGAHVITVVAAPEKEGDTVSPIVGARVEIVNASGKLLTDKNAVTDANGQFAYCGEGGRELRIYADGYQLRRMIYVMVPGESKLILLDKLPTDGAPYFSMLCGKVYTSYEKVGYDKYRDLHTQEVRYTQNDGKGIQPSFEIVTNDDIYIESVEIMQKEGVGEELPRYIEINANDYLIYDPETPFASIDATSVAPGQLHADRRIYAVINYRKRSEALAEFHTVEVPLSLFIDPAPSNTPTESNGIDTTLEPGTATSGSVSWLESFSLPSDNVLFSTFLNANPSITSDLLGFTYCIVEEDPGDFKLRIALGLGGGEKTVNMLTGKTQDDVKAYKKFRNEILNAKNSKKKALGFIKSEIGKTLKEEFKTTSLKSIGKMEGEIIGYLEVDLDDRTKLPRYDSQGKILNADGKVLVNITGEVVGGKTFLISGFPLYFEYKAGAGLATTLNIDLKAAAQSAGLILKPKLEQVDLTIPKLSLEGGVGVRGVATVGVGGTFENTVTNILSEAGDVTSKIVGTTNAFFRVYVAFLVDYKKEFLSQDGGKLILYTYPDEGSGIMTYSVDRTLQQQALTEPEPELNSRDYLQQQSQWNCNPIQLLSSDSLATLQNGVLPNAMPELIDLGGSQLLLFLADDGSRALGNHTQLMYSVCENGTWSQPAPVWDTATGDQYFDCAMVDGELYVAWQKLRGAVSGEDVNSMLASLAEQSEIALARWDSETGTFTQQQYLTDNDRLDMMASLCDVQGTLNVTWVTNSENNLMGTSGENTVKTLFFRDGQAGAAEELYTTDRFLTELVTAANHQGLHVLVGALDEEYNTDLLHLNGSDVHTVMTDGAFAGLSAEDGCFLWQNDGIIYRYSPEIKQYEAMVSLDGHGISSSYRYVNNGQTEAFLWSQGQEPTRIMVSFRSQGVWHDPVVLVDNIDNSISFLDGAMMADGSFLLVANTADYSGENDSNTALKTALVIPMADVTISNVRVDIPTPGSTDRELCITLENHGLYPLAQESVRVTLADDAGNLLLDRDVMVQIAPGGSYQFNCPISLDGFTGIRECTLTVTSNRDMDTSNNRYPLTLGYTDAALDMDVQEVGDQVYILLTASNSSCVPTEARIRVHKGTLDSDALAVLELGTLVYGENTQRLYTLDKTAVDFGDGDSAYFLFSLETNETDTSDSDDLQVCTVRKPQAQPDPDFTDREEIITVHPKSIEILSDRIFFDDPASEPMKLEVLILPADSSFIQPIWTVEDPDVVTVLSDGTLYPRAPGTTTVTASLNDELYDTLTVTVGHTATVHEHVPVLCLGLDATCTEPGLSDGTYCAECGEILIEQTPIDPLGHNWDGASCARCGKPQENPFTDVPENSFYYEPVLWAVAEDITTGTTATTFDPNSQCMRAVVVTFLWRAAGSPEPVSSHNPFTDVKEDDFFYKAVLWAVEKGITNGTSSAEFSPYALCNRAQVVTFLWRSNGSPKSTAGKNPFTDVASGSFYYDAVLWAVEHKITNGMTATSFGVDNICNRAQVVTFLYRSFSE